MFRFLQRFFLSSKKPYIQRGLSSGDEQIVKNKWLEIEELVKLGSPSRFKTAILEADKLLDFVLKKLGYPGKNLGERMKAIPREKYSRGFFDNMWEAHKVRNEIVHNVSYEIHSAMARDVIEKFRFVFKTLKIL